MGCRPPPRKRFAVGALSSRVSADRNLPRCDPVLAFPPMRPDELWYCCFQDNAPMPFSAPIAAAWCLFAQHLATMYSALCQMGYAAVWRTEERVGVAVAVGKIAFEPSHRTETQCSLEHPFSKYTILAPLNCQPAVSGWRRRL